MRIFGCNGTLIRECAARDGGGAWSATWDGRGMSGTVAPAGAYVYKYYSGNDGRSGKLIVAR